MDFLLQASLTFLIVWPNHVSYNKLQNETIVQEIGFDTYPIPLLYSMSRDKGRVRLISPGCSRASPHWHVVTLDIEIRHKSCSKVSFLTLQQSHNNNNHSKEADKYCCFFFTKTNISKWASLISHPLEFRPAFERLLRVNVRVHLFFFYLEFLCVCLCACARVHVCVCVCCVIHDSLTNHIERATSINLRWYIHLQREEEQQSRCDLQAPSLPDTQDEDFGHPAFRLSGCCLSVFR